MQEIITKNAEETRKLGLKLSKKINGGEIICLEGELGSGKTTFSQGILEGLGAEKPYTSPTFLVMKKYDIENNNIKNVYHIDTYRVEEGDVLDLGWEEITKSSENIVIVEWPERINSIIPGKSLRISFKSVDKDQRIVNYPDNIV